MVAAVCWSVRSLRVVVGAGGVPGRAGGVPDPAGAARRGWAGLDDRRGRRANIRRGPVARRRGPGAQGMGSVAERRVLRVGGDRDLPVRAGRV